MSYAARLTIRIINKGRVDKDGMPHREMRVFMLRTDGTIDRIGTLSVSWGRCVILRKILQAGCEALRVGCEITEPVRAAAGLG